MRTDNAPDVAGLAAQGLLTDLTSMISAADKADFVQAALKGGEYNGKIYAVPQTVDALALFYNKALFKARGSRSRPRRWPSCQRLPEVRRRQGNLLSGDSYWIAPWIWGYGGGLVDMAKKQILVGSKQSIAGWSGVQLALPEQVRVPEQGLLERLRQRDDGLQERPGRHDRERPVVDRGRALGPGVQEARPTSRSPCSRPAPAARARRSAAELSWSAATHSTRLRRTRSSSWLTAPAQQAVFAAKNNLLPSHISAYKLPDVKKNRLIVAFLAALQKGTDRSAGTQGAQLYTDWTPAMQSMLSGKIDPGEGGRRRRGGLEDQALPELHRGERNVEHLEFRST